MKLEILNPVANSVVKKTAVAGRVKDLTNKRIGLYWNGKAGGDVALTTIGEHLVRRFEGAQVELIASSIPGGKDKIEAAKQFAAVVGSTAD